MKAKAILSIILSAIYLFVINLYSSFQGSIESQIAVKQLDDSMLSYGASNFVISSNVYSVIHFIFWASMAYMWSHTIINIIKKQMNEEK